MTVEEVLHKYGMDCAHLYHEFCLRLNMNSGEHDEFKRQQMILRKYAEVNIRKIIAKENK